MKLFLIAGEPSGDNLGAALMAGLRELAPGVGFLGVGGPAMQAEGLESRFPMEELSVMGIWEVLPKYRALKARIAETAQAIAETKPDALINHRQPGFLPAGGASGPRAEPRSAHHPLCRALGLGLAGGAGEKDGSGHRPCAGDPAL